MKTISKKVVEPNIEELISKRNRLKNAIIGLGIVMVVACIALFYLALTTKKYVLVAVAVGCICSLIPGIMGVDLISKKIKSKL